MPKFTVETSYQVPNYRQRTFIADTVEQACSNAIGDDDWSGEIPDHEAAGETYVSGIWEGADAAYSGQAVAIPMQFMGLTSRKLALFDTLVDLLREPAQPMGLSRHDFANWLPRAVDALATVDAIDQSAEPAGGPLPT